MRAVGRSTLKTLLLLPAVLFWTPVAVACSVWSLDDLIGDAFAHSRKYWIASILVGGVVVCLGEYRKRWSISTILTLALLIFHPHLTVWPFPMPSCQFISVQASQAALVLLLLMLGYLVIRILLMSRRTNH